LLCCFCRANSTRPGAVATIKERVGNRPTSAGFATSSTTSSLVGRKSAEYSELLAVNIRQPLIPEVIRGNTKGPSRRESDSNSRTSIFGYLKPRLPKAWTKDLQALPRTVRVDWWIQHLTHSSAGKTLAIMDNRSTIASSQEHVTRKMSHRVAHKRIGVMGHDGGR
jgi:hypothetical protein